MNQQCIVCRERYYRRNMTIMWYKNTKGVWVSHVAKGHPSCLRILNRVTNMWKKSA